MITRALIVQVFTRNLRVKFRNVKVNRSQMYQNTLQLRTQWYDIIQQNYTVNIRPNHTAKD